ncbi:MAG: hypothetical protein CM1200mP22_09810 [Dehalococcoidia bacterium]|nr:MAG: hypothetical protein CM1200mP22_09810 [Dehalococcoidia bacterium]
MGRDLFSLVLAATIVVSMQVLGVLLIAGATVIPPVSARMLSDRFSNVCYFRRVWGAICGFVGIYLSFFIDVSSGASVVLVEARCFLWLWPTRISGQGEFLVHFKTPRALSVG